MAQSTTGVPTTELAPLELAMQELNMHELEAMDAPGWSDIASFIGGLSAGGVVSYISIVTLAT